MAAGVVLGLATGLFLRSKKGQVLTNDVEKHAALLQKQVVARVRGVEELSEELYDDVVDEVLELYARGKEVVREEVPILRRELRKRWKMVKALVDKHL